LLRERTLLRKCGNTGKLLLEWTLLRQCGNTGKAGNTEKTPVGAEAAAVVWECRKGSCGSGHCCGSVEIQGRLLWERALLRHCRSIEKAPAGAVTPAAVGRNREKGRHCCGSGEIQKRLLREQGAAGVVFKGMAMVGL
ncbi:hypothetical protein M9458_037893, partial [Cirrhinus mrigala]